MKQERHIQKMIDMDDIPGLTKLLSGRGDGKLVMHCKSKYAMEEWKVNLEECCSGKFLESLPVNEYGKKDVNAICMKSTFEKAARNTKGLVGGWKRRYFVLQATNMQYYTKQYGTKKGEIRVLGGGIRVLEPSEAGGRKYCLELEEGRDITLIDPDLIEEAKKTVRKAKIKSIRIDLRKGIKAMSLELLTKALQLASDLDVIQGPVIEEAKLCVRSIKEKSIKRDVLVAAKLVPKAQLRELISIAETVNLDPNIKSYRRLLILADKSELFQHIMRARGALEIKNEEMFVKAFKAIIRTDLKQFTTLDRLMLTAVIFQHTGYVVLKMATQGVPVHLLSKLFRHALSCSSQLLVETEPMDLGKIMMMMFAGTENINIRQSMVHTRQPLSSQGKIANISSYLDGIKLFLPDPQFAIFKYPRLRAYSSHKSRGLGITNPFSQRRNQLNALELLDHTTTGIAKSLLKYDPLQGVDQKYCIEAFHALQVIMGDLTVASIPRWTRKGSLFAEKEVYKIVVNLIELASKKQPLLANEIYFQCVKQLTSNPSDQSLIRGWILLTLYFHTFPPSKDSLGYLQHFVTSSISELQQKREAIKTDTGVPKDDDDGNDKNQFNAEEFRIQKDLMLRRNKYLLHLTGYCDFLLRTLEVYYLRDHASLIARTKREENLSLRPYPVFPSNSVISKDMVELAFEQNPIEIEVVLMTGSIIRLNISYGQFYSPYTLLQFLFERIVAIDEYNSVFDTYVDIYEEAQGSNVVEVLDAVKQDATVNAATDKTLTSRQKESEDVKTNRLQSLFRGFGLYCTDESDLNDAKSMVDLQKIPVQPKSDRWIDWTYDLQWDLLLNNAQNVPTENFLHDDKSTKFKSSNTLVLRRKVAMRSEFFADTYQIFGTQIPENDSTALVNLWNNWLQTTGQVLPLDSLRLDLIFAEDTRAVNSGLYPLSTDSFHYLMGLQVAICWINESAALWGDGDDDVADGANLSIRPCYKFRPKHLLHERKILTDKNGEDIKVSSPMSEEIDPAARQIRSSVRKSAPRRSVWQIGKSSTPSADSESDNSVTENEEKQRDSDVSSDESEINRMVEETKKKLQMQEDSEYESDASSEYVSSVESDDSVLDETMAFRTKARNPIKSFASMTELEREELLRILESIGVNMDNVSLEKLVHWISQFHEVAVDAKIPLTSPKYRYLLKRAYTHYLMSCPLYGCSYFSSVLLTESLKKNNRKTAAFETEDSGKDKTNEIVHSKNTLDFNQDILVCIDSTGITFLDPDSWAIIFKSPIHDLLEVRLRKFSEFVQFYGKSLSVSSIEIML